MKKQALERVAPILCHVDVVRNPTAAATVIVSAFDRGFASWERAAGLLSVSRRTLARWVEMIGEHDAKLIPDAVEKLTKKHAKANHERHVECGRMGALARYGKSKKRARR